MTEKISSLKDFVPLMILVLASDDIFTGSRPPASPLQWERSLRLVLAGAYNKLTWECIVKSLRATAEVTGFTLFIIASATAFSQILAYSGAVAGLSRFAVDLPVPPS